MGKAPCYPTLTVEGREAQTGGRASRAPRRAATRDAGSSNPASQACYSPKEFYIRTWAVAILENGSQQCSGPCRNGMSISPIMVFNHSPFLTPTQLAHSDLGLWIHLSTAALCEEEVCSATVFCSRTGLFPTGLPTLVLPCPSSVPPNVSFGI